MDGIFEVEGILTENDCDRLIEIYNANINHTEPGKIQAGTTAVFNKNVKVTTDLFLNMDDPVIYAGARIVHQACSKTCKKYIKHCQELGLDRGRNDSPSILSHLFDEATLSYPQIQKVTRNGRFNWHTDCHLGHIIQFIFYLNDDYVGGRTEFSNGRIIEPKKGKVVIIPCTPQAIHRGNVVTEGTKYISAVYLDHPGCH